MRIAMIGQKGFEIGERGGGVEQHVRELSSHLGARGHEVTVYARRHYGTARQERRGVVVRYVPTVYRKNLEAIVHTFLSTVDAILRGHDVIHYHGVGPSTLAWIPRLFRPSARVVVTFHSQDRFHRKWGLLARLYLWLGEWAACWLPHATIAVSHVIQVYAREHYRRQIIYIPNGAEVRNARGSDRLAAFGLRPGRYVLNVGRLVAHKGQRLLVEGFRRMKEAQPAADGFELVLVGAPTYTTDYERQLARDVEGREDVRLLGYQTGEELRQLFAHAYLYVQPSESEGLPVVVLEAMSYGRPVLVSDIPENLEAMAAKGGIAASGFPAGFSFRNKDAADLADKLSELVANPARVEEAASHAREVVRRNFSWEVITVHTEAVYLSVRH